ncbi:hypothetical protein [Laedolimicola intestinihominis]|uniref:Uncharacterized protein n=1 Tax=Laedolimicola intestinihominis TaxID=3133166 RepID=A0ABV1FIT8_9FIRM
MLLEKLEQESIKKELEALGYNCEEIFGGLKEETDRLYASYSWQKIPCTVEGIREYVIHAVPPKELREKDYPWEEWFIQFDEPVHHVLFMHDQEICNAEAPIPEGDTQHPAEICGRTWYYYDDKNSYPHFAGKAEPR